VALVTYEFLSGAHPFAGAAISRRIVQDEPEPLSTYAPQFPESLNRVLRKGLEKDPDKRFQSADEFGRELRAEAGKLGRATEPVPVLEAPRVEAPVSGIPPELAATRILCLPTAPHPPPELPKRRLSRRVPLAAALVLALAVSGVALYRYLPLPLRPKAAPQSHAPAAATATVATQEAPVYGEPSATSRQVAAARPAETVEILRIPLSAEQEWVPVRVGEAGSRVEGYVRVDRLQNWSSRDPAAALRLVATFGLSPPFTPERIASQIERLRPYVDSPQAGEAKLQIAWLYTLLAREERERAADASVWQGHLSEAEKYLQAAGPGAADGEVRRQIAALKPAPRSEPLPQPQHATTRSADRQVSPRGVERAYRADLARVELYWKNGLYAQAERETRLYLRQHPGDRTAAQWEERIARARRAEAESQR
jgi:hypothetical protein